MQSQACKKHFRIRSFVRRDSRITVNQAHAFSDLLPRFGLPVDQGHIDFHAEYKRICPLFVEIGFGSGSSLLALAQSNPDKNYMGIETYKPGIGALLQGVALHDLTNIRVFYGDAWDVFSKAIPPEYLDGIQIFFPDPWQKRRHHPRRLVQTDFMHLLATKLKAGGELHLATDWEDYAKHMMQVLSQEPLLRNTAGENQYAKRSHLRLNPTKFEQRALRVGRKIFELQFAK